MDAAALVAEWGEVYARPVSGWDFGELQGVTQDDTPWSYSQVVREALSEAASALDIGTGGGEFLLQIAHALPPDTTATEGWEPNVATASTALASLNIPVVPYRAGRDVGMPFGERRFDVVMARHEAYDAVEVARILRLGGVLVTQQVEAGNLRELRALLEFETPYPDQTLKTHVESATRAGLVVHRGEVWEGKTSFPNVSSMVRYLAMVPWEAPDDFSPERYADVLLGLHATNEPVTFSVRRFLLIARRPVQGA